MKQSTNCFFFTSLNSFKSIFFIQPADQKCEINKDATLPIVVQGFESLTPYMTINGDVRLPAPDGYVGSGACIDEFGPGNCITLESNALGCPYEPDECTEVILV